MKLSAWLRRPLRHLAMRASRLAFSPPTKFVIVTRGRTGSNLLVSLLNSHPRIRQCGEVFGESQLRQEDIRAEIMRQGAVPYLDRCLARRGIEATAGVKALYYQLLEPYSQRWGLSDLPDVLPHLQSAEGFRFIHLKRRNKLACLASIKATAISGRWELTSKDERRSDFRIELTPEQCEDEFRRTEERERQFDSCFRHRPLLEVYYEQLAADTEPECRRILDFLGVSQRRLQAGTVRQNVRPLSETIKNFDELRDRFAGTPYEEFFAEPAAPPP